MRSVCWQFDLGKNVEAKVIFFETENGKILVTNYSTIESRPTDIFVFPGTLFDTSTTLVR